MRTAIGWKPQKGFTLIEVMIVAAIVAILAAVAFPSYQEHVRKSRRADCTTVMMSLANAMERRYSLSTPASYLAVAPATQIPPGFATCPSNPGAAGAFYNITMPVATATTFTIRAAPAGAQAGDKCGTLTLTHAGVKGVDGATGGMTAQTCW